MDGLLTDQLKEQRQIINLYILEIKHSLNYNKLLKYNGKTFLHVTQFENDSPKLQNFAIKVLGIECWSLGCK